MDRFDLENDIMSCWNVTTDIQTLYKGVITGKMSNEEIANFLLGLKIMYELKFDQLFQNFEKLIEENKIQ